MRKVLAGFYFVFDGLFDVFVVLAVGYYQGDLEGFAHLLLPALQLVLGVWEAVY